MATELPTSLVVQKRTAWEVLSEADDKSQPAIVAFSGRHTTLACRAVDLKFRIAGCVDSLEKSRYILNPVSRLGNAFSVQVPEIVASPDVHAYLLLSSTGGSASRTHGQWEDQHRGIL
jgi:hypothetical protein